MISLKTPLCDILGISVPICLAGMGAKGKGTPPALVAAVSNAGGLGVIGGAAYGPEMLLRTIRETRRLTDRPIGVNLLMPSTKYNPGKGRDAVRAELTERFPEHVAFVAGLRERFGLPPVTIENDVAVSRAATSDSAALGAKGGPSSVYEEQLEIVFSERVEVIAPALGDCTPLVPRAHANGTRVVALAGTIAHGKRSFAAGADAIVAQGAEAGGHVGTVSNFALIPGMVDAVAPKPVLAAGAITDGRGLAAALALGAQGVWVGTAFLVAEECAVPEAHKQQIIAGRAQDFTANSVYSGSPIRGFRNDVIRLWEESGLEILPAIYQKVLMDDFNAAVEAAGRDDLHNNPAGQGAGNITAIRPAAEIVQTMVEEASVILRNLAR
jgi:nitronate monooxygenase